EAERQHVLDRLLAQVVVDAEDLLLREDRKHFAVEFERLPKRGAERLLDDAADIGAFRARQSRLAERIDDDREELRRRREIERTRHRLAGGLVELVARVT